MESRVFHCGDRNYEETPERSLQTCTETLCWCHFAVLFSGWISRMMFLSNISLQNRTSSSRKWEACSDLLNDPRAANTSLTSIISCHDGWVDKCTEVKWWWLGCRRPSEDSAGTHITNIPGYFMDLWRSMRDVGNVQCYMKKGCCVSVWKWSRRENPASSENHGGFQSSLPSYWIMLDTNREVSSINSCTHLPAYPSPS